MVPEGFSLYSIGPYFVCLGLVLFLMPSAFKTPVTVWLPLAYFVLTALSYALFPHWQIEFFPDQVRHAAGIQLIYWLVFLWLDQSLKFKPGLIIDACLVLAVLDTFWLTFGGKSFLTGNTFDTGLFGCLAPLYWRRGLYWRIASFFPLVYLLSTKGGASGYFTLFAALVGVLWALREWRLLFTLACLGLGIFLSVIPISTGGRLSMWQEYVGFVLEKRMDLLGFGPGSFQVLGPFLEVRGKRYMWAHNDWLEMYFEAGLIGALLGLIAYIWVLKTTFPKPLHFGFLLSFGVLMMSYSPMQYLLFPLLAYCVLKEATKNEDGGHGLRDACDGGPQLVL